MRTHRASETRRRGLAGGGLATPSARRSRRRFAVAWLWRGAPRPKSTYGFLTAGGRWLISHPSHTSPVLSPPPGGTKGCSAGAEAWPPCRAMGVLRMCIREIAQDTDACSVDLLLLLKLQAFSSRSSDNNLELEEIGKNIVHKLEEIGKSIAAKTFGCLMRRNLDTTYWNNMLNSGLWKLDIMKIFTCICVN
uniref:NB-ARC domain-containing protein n=1 Tax=Oryza punctata TaxID=4537 RepID=A0A0E0MMI7_ORYPU